jgi:octaprenyl-diphosphate synthase
MTNQSTAAIPELIKQCRTSVAKPWDDCNTLIKDQFDTPIALIHDILMHMLGRGGKRLRPLLVLLSAAACNPQQNARTTKFAVAIEFIHTATLLHDDVVDHSSLRRGVDTANEIWGGNASILVGDYVYSRAFELLTDCDNNAALRALVEVTTAMSEGEVMQLTNAGSSDINRSEYYKTIERKTAGLFQAAAQIGAISADASSEKTLAMREFGREIGICYQIIDDILDYSATDESFGKKLGKDLEEQKTTLPLIIALEELGPADAEQLKQHFKAGASDLNSVLKLMQQTNALDLARQAAKQHHDNAINAISVIDDSEHKQALLDFCTICLQRGS